MALDLAGKWGPLPKWAWLGGGGLAAVGLVIVRARQKKAAAAASSSTTAGSSVGTADESGDTGTDTSGQYSPPTSSVTTPGGASVTGPSSGIDQTLCILQGGTWDGSNCTYPSAVTPPSQPTAPNNPPAQQSLPPVNPTSYPTNVPYGSYNASDYTKIGTVGSNGIYTGGTVIPGVPVYANVFGGFVQNFNPKTLPSGTGIYIPSQFAAYVNGQAPGNTYV